ncbi:MAG: hypothetical protein ACJ0GK_03065 [Gammaproteobacteria bacterium]
MICNNCGANSANPKVCDYCGSRIQIVDVADVLVEEESKRAQLLNLSGDLSYVFSDKENPSQIFERIIARGNEFLVEEPKQIKKAEFFGHLALKKNPNDDKALFLNAEINTCYAERTSGSVQMASIKKKYISEARKLLSKSDFDNLSDWQGLYNVETIYERLDFLDGRKASAFTVQGDLDSDTGVSSVLNDNSSSMGGCLTVGGWIVGGIIAIGFFLA